MTIKELKEEESILIRQLDLNRYEQRKINIELFCKKTNLYKEDVVEFTHCRKTVKGMINSFYFSGLEPLWPIVKLFNKDGRLGSKEAHLYNVDKAKKIS